MWVCGWVYVLGVCVSNIDFKYVCLIVCACVCVRYFWCIILVYFYILVDVISHVQLPSNR